MILLLGRLEFGSIMLVRAGSTGGKMMTNDDKKGFSAVNEAGAGRIGWGPIASGTPRPLRLSLNGPVGPRRQYRVTPGGMA
jgi:hypothetical protein